jgi:hypothetical protein
MALNIKVRDKGFAPVENTTVQITVEGPPEKGKTNRVSFVADASDKEPGVYRAAYLPRESGGYHATAVISDNSGLKLGECETAWTAEPLAKEFASLQPNRPLLEEIARKTGGEVLTMDGLSHFVQSLKKKKAPIIESYSFPLWHTGTVFLLAMCCFVTEWGVRRVKGLA